MNLNHQLNPIYSPQGLCITTMIEAYARNPYEARVTGQRKVSDKVAVNMQKARAVRAKSQTGDSRDRYKAAFAGERKTARELETAMKLKRSAVGWMLRKLVKDGIVRKTGTARGNQVVWEWID